EYLVVERLDETRDELLAAAQEAALRAVVDLEGASLEAALAVAERLLAKLSEPRPGRRVAVVRQVAAGPAAVLFARGLFAHEIGVGQRAKLQAVDNVAVLRLGSRVGVAGAAGPAAVAAHEFGVTALGFEEPLLALDGDVD